MVKKTFISLLLVGILSIFVSFNNTTRERHRFEDSEWICFYETKQGRIDGKYVSFYKNKKLRSEGTFENNYRAGKWMVSDSTGKLKLKRKYQNPFSFKAIVHAISNKLPDDSLHLHKYSIRYNKDGYIENFDLKENMIVWSKRIWRELRPAENPVLFQNNRLFNILNKNILAKNITPFYTTDDEFKNEITSGDTCTISFKVVRYKIKEDSFYDNVRNVLETRIVGIAPVVVKEGKNDTIDLCWLYLPQIRKYLAQEKINQKGLPAKIKTLDDLFFYRNFYGKIYKESNVYNRAIADYKKGKEMDKEAERVEIDLIEAEHNIWLYGQNEER